MHPAESAYLLGALIHACPRLVLPYVSAILKALVAKLRAAPSLQITAAGPPGTAAKATLVQGKRVLRSVSTASAMLPSRQVHASVHLEVEVD